MILENKIKEYLAAHATNIPEDFFLLWNERSQDRAICYMNEKKKPMIMMIDDEELANAIIKYLLQHSVKEYESIKEAQNAH